MIIITVDYAVGQSKQAELIELKNKLRGSGDIAILNTINMLRNDYEIYYSIPYGEYIELYTKQYQQYSVIVNALANEDNSIHLVSVSRTNDNSRIIASKTIEVVLVPEIAENKTNIFTNGLFADEGYSFMGAATANYYDSDPSSTEGVPTILGSNGFISVQKPKNVEGNVESNIGKDVPELSIEIPSTSIYVGNINGPISLSEGIYNTNQIDFGSINVKGIVILYVNGNINFKESNAITFF